MRNAVISGVLGSLLLAVAANAQTATTNGSPAATGGTSTPATPAPVSYPVTSGTSDAAGAPSTTDPSAGAFAKLSPGNQSIARALFSAQTTSSGTTPTGTTQSGSTQSGTVQGGTTQSGPKPLTLDQIAALKASGQGWGQVFRQMRAQGLTTEKNLGEAVSEYRHQQADKRHESHHAERQDHDGDRGADNRSHTSHHRDRDDVAVTSALGSTQSTGHSHGANHRTREANNASVASGLGSVHGGSQAAPSTTSTGKSSGSGSHAHARE